MKSQPKAAGAAASKLISEKIANLGDWRGDTLATMRALIREADPDVLEEWKWMGTPVWSHAPAIGDCLFRQVRRQRAGNVSCTAAELRPQRAH